MTTIVVATGATIKQVFACEYHHAFVEIKVESFDKGLFGFGFNLSFPLHIAPKTPCSPPLPVLANRSRLVCSIPAHSQKH